MHAKTTKHRKSKTLLLLLCAAIFLCGAAKTTLYAQTASSTPTQTNQQIDEQRRLALVEALERAQREVIAGREYVDVLEGKLKSAAAIIAAQEKRQTLSDQAIALLRKQAAEYQAALDEQKRRIEIDKKEIIYLRAELDQTNRKLKRSRTVNKYLIAGLAGIIIALFAK